MLVWDAPLLFAVPNVGNVTLLALHHLFQLWCFFDIRAACGRFSEPEFFAPMRNVSATQGQNVVFTCHIRNLGRNSVAWVKTEPGKLLAYNEKIFRNKHRYRIEVKETESVGLVGGRSGEGKDWSLHISNVQPTDAGGYMCQINTHPMSAHTAFLNLKVSPRILQASTSKDSEVREGQNVSLHCAASGSPPPIISWRRKDGGIIILGGPDGYGTSTVNGPTLTMMKVSRAHMTEYMCVARNGILPHESWTMKLHVTFPPTVIPAHEEVEGSLGGTATLACRAQAWPRPEFRWRFQGAQITATDSSRHHIKFSVSKDSANSYETMSHLHIRDLRPEDFGTYLCVATNELGSKEVALQMKNDYSVRPSYGQTNLLPDASQVEALEESPSRAVLKERGYSAEEVAKNEIKPLPQGDPGTSASAVWGPGLLCVLGLLVLR